MPPGKERFQRLRGRAEARLKKSSSKDSEPTVADANRLLHELQVHQAELEIQNEELQRIQLELETARDRFSMLYDLAPVGYVTLDAEAEIREANLTAAAMMGYERAALVGRRFSYFIIREDQDRFYFYQEAVYLSQTKKSCELQVLKADGGTLPVEMVSIAVHDQQGFRKECLVALIDITERRKNEAERARLAAIVESSHDAIISCGLDDSILSWNRGAEQMLGYPAAEVLGRACTFLLPPEQRKELETVREAIDKGQKLDAYETLRVARDGRNIPVSVTVSPVHDASGRIIGISSITRDIERQKAAEETIRRSEHELADFFNHSPLGLLWVGPDGTILRTNRTQLELIGCAPEEAVGRKISSFFADPELAGHILQQLARNETLNNYRARLRDTDGSLKHVLIDANGLWESNRLVHSRWFVRDITRRVELEREILAISEREQRRIGQDLHDDLGQQLAGLEYLAQTLTSRMTPVSRPAAAEAKKIAEMARRAMDHARELAHGLAPIGPEPDGLMVALRQLTTRTRRIFRIDCRFRSSPAVLIPDQEIGAHLFRIAQEAVSNAIKHGKARRIDIGLVINHERIVLAVSDNGIGMPTRPRKRKGMGLRVMQYRAGVIGGSLIVQRQPNGGTTFVCTIKHSPADAKKKKTKEKKDANQKKPRGQ